MTLGAMERSRTIEACEKARQVAWAASEGKAEDVVVIDVSAVSSITDVFVIFTCTSQPHLRAIAQRIEEHLDKMGVKPARVDGYQSSNWLVLDYGSVIVHAMLRDAREHYALERLWGDAPMVAWA